MDITQEMDDKLAAIMCHKCQYAWSETFMDTGFLDYAKAMAKYRGFQSGKDYAEGFVSHKMYAFMADPRMLP